MATTQKDPSIGEGGLIFNRFLQLNGLIIICLSVIYYFWKLPFWLGPTLLVFGNFYLAIKYRLVFVRFLTSSFEPDDVCGLLYATGAIIVDICLLIVAWSNRTDLPLTSPWQALPTGTFVLFGVSCFFALMAFNSLKPNKSLILAILHSCVTFSLLALIYALGFGYDGFVHEATMAYIDKYGAILPKQLFYIGEYVLILPLHQITRLPISLIQQVLLPILAGSILPCLLYFSGYKKQYWIIWIMLYAPFTFTVPYNFALLWCVLSFLTMGLNGKKNSITSIILAFCSFFTHPLVGIPAVCASIMNIIGGRFRSKWLILITAIFVSASLVSALYLYTKLNGGHILIPTLEAIFDSAAIILRSPADFHSGNAFWSVLYIFYAAWPYLSIFVGLIGLIFFGLREKFHIYLGISIGILFSAIIAAASFRYNNIISQEQYEFSYRLVSLLPWIFFPGMLISVKHFEIRILDGKRIIYSILGAGLAVLIWYVSYPQYNPAMPYYAPSISRTELEAANWIMDEIGMQDYAVLAPQLVSAGALRTIGFEKHLDTADGQIYPFAIPTGGTLYRIYLDFLTGRDMPGSLKEAVIFSNSDYLAVVVYKSWDPYGVLADYLNNIAWKKYTNDDLGTFILKRQTILLQ